MEDLLSDLSLSRSTSIEESYGFELIDGVLCKALYAQPGRSARDTGCRS